MCGILGIAGPRGRELVRERVRDLAHRGPDAEGVWDSETLTLGHRRLAIIGLDPEGCQPMRSRSGESLLDFNGEIYNYLELADRLEAAGHPVDRRFDSSALLEALEVWGVDCLSELNGMFAFAWYRPRAKKLLLARDRWGKKPLFFGRVDLGTGRPELVFASELSVFRRLPGGPPRPDPLGVARYLVYDGMPDQRTVYAGVEKLPAASWIEIDLESGAERRGRYWSFDPRIEQTEAEPARERALAALHRSLELRLRSDVPVGLFLSGGIDSSLLAAVWRRVLPNTKIRTFTIGFEDPSYDESASARCVARAIGSDHFEAVLTGAALERELDFVWENLSEPFADPSIIPFSFLCRLARTEAIVALGGDGADELQAGYDPFRAWRTARNLERLVPRGLLYQGLRALESSLPADPRNMSLRFKARHFKQGFLHPANERIQGWMASFPLPAALGALHPDLREQVEAAEVLEPTRRAFEAVADRGDLQAQIHTWLQTYLECSILTKVDRGSMMHSLEVRAPFLDPAVAAAMTNLPDRLIFDAGSGKSTLRRMARGLVPDSVLEKKKKGFGVPQAEWLRTILRERFESALDRTRAGSGWFDARAIEPLWQRHLAGTHDFRKSLWSYLFASPFQER